MLASLGTDIKAGKLYQEVSSLREISEKETLIFLFNCNFCLAFNDFVH